VESTPSRVRTRVPHRGRTVWLALTSLLALAMVAPANDGGERAAPDAVPETAAASLGGFEEQGGVPGGSLASSPRIGERLGGITHERLPDGLRGSVAVRSPIAFTAVGFELPEGADGVWYRFHGPDGWSSWEHLEAMDAEDGPDLDTPEAGAADEERFSELAWVGEARQLQVATGPDVAPAQVVARVSDTSGLAPDAPTRRVPDLTAGSSDSSSRPDVIRRSQWGANEDWRQGRPSYADVSQGIVHHTATRNYYSREDAPAIVRSIYHYHTQVLGWSDIGYNLLVDRFGRIYEGRAGGLEDGVVGAHARGHNTGTFGVSVIGDYHDAPPRQVAVDAAGDVVDWMFDVHDIDPDGRHRDRSTLIGHRDVGETVCPGQYLHRRLGEIRDAAR
jgi:hypothetical protein